MVVLSVRKNWIDSDSFKEIFFFWPDLWRVQIYNYNFSFPQNKVKYSLTCFHLSSVYYCATEERASESHIEQKTCDYCLQEDNLFLNVSTSEKR